MLSISKIALPSSWQYASEVGAFVVLGIMVGWFGAKQQAAHQISIMIAAFTFMVSMGLSAAGSIKVGEAYGNKDIILARSMGKASLQLALVYGIICGILFISLNNWIPQLFSDDEQVIKIATSLLILGAVFQISDSCQAVGIGILRGMQDVKLPTIYTTICYWLIGIPSGYFLSYRLGMKANGIWIGFIICLTIVSLLLLWRFHKITKQNNAISFPAN